MSRVGNYVVTFTGGRWWPHDPRPEDVRVGDLAALAQVCRFGGATSYQWPEWRRGRLAPYTVAQHSCLVYELVEEWLAGNCGNEAGVLPYAPTEIALIRRAALLHDGHEVYPPGDMLSPVLRHVRQNINCCSPQIEIANHTVDAIKAMSRAAATAFRTAVKIPDVMPEIVKRADAVLLATEKRDLMPLELAEWGDNGRTLPPPRERRIEVWDPEHAREAFFRRLRDVAPDLLAASS